VTGTLGNDPLTLGQAFTEAEKALGQTPAAWWCEPTLDLSVSEVPVTFGISPPRDSDLRVDEALFFTTAASWRLARCRDGCRTVLIREVPKNPGAQPVEVVRTPARLHADGTRFAARYATGGGVEIREWHADGQALGFTLLVHGER
jgi:hypothetical protein